MTEQKIDRRGTFWDWPTGWVLAGVLLLYVGLTSEAGGGAFIGVLLIAFGGLATAIRRGAFTPRERP